MTKYYDYVHDPDGRYDGRADASLLLYLGIGYVVINGIVWFFRSGIWIMTLAAILTILVIPAIIIKMTGNNRHGVILILMGICLFWAGMVIAAWAGMLPWDNL